MKIAMNNIKFKIARWGNSLAINLRAGDALHLTLAKAIGVFSVATLDHHMKLNATRLGLATVEFSATFLNAP